MSAAALDHVWNVADISAEEKLTLLWFGNSSGGLGYPVCPDWISLGQFVGVPYERACDLTYSLVDKGLILQGADEEETAHCFWLVWDGIYERPIDWTAETKSRSKRVTALIERDGPNCAYCGCSPINYEVDHFIPKARGGEDMMCNLLLSCVPCNRAKRDKMPEVFLSDRPKLFRTLSSGLNCLHA